MKLTKEVIEQIESSDAYYVITIKDKTNFTYFIKMVDYAPYKKISFHLQK